MDINVRAIEKLVDYTASGVGAIAGPIIANWKASREGRARITSARADAEVRLIETESEAKASLPIAKAQSEARSFLLPSDVELRGTLEITNGHIAQSIEFQNRKRFANIQSVLEDAADDLGDKEVPDHEPDPDWTARFFNCVQDISSEDMQRIWAKLLAGEVESPGRTSLRTLETLRNMRKEDAITFRSICDFVVNNEFFYYDDPMEGFDALALVSLLDLQDCGLITSERNLIMQETFDNRGYLVLLHQGRTLLVTNQGETHQELKIPCIRLTSSGAELSRFVQTVFQKEYLEAFSKFLKSKGCELSYLEDAIHLPDGLVRYTNRISIEPESEEIKEPAE